MHRHSDRGASAVEYGLLVAAVVAGLIGIMTGMGDLVGQTMTCSTSSMSQAAADDAEAAGCPASP